MLQLHFELPASASSFQLPSLLLTSTSHFNVRASPLQTSNVRLHTFADSLPYASPSVIIPHPHVAVPPRHARDRRPLPPARHRPHLAARDQSRDAVAERQRRRPAERVDPGVGRAPAPARARAPLRRQHLLSRARLARLLRAADRPGSHGRAAALARGLAGARLQPRSASGLRADGVGRLRGRVRVDRGPHRRDARRLDVRVQHAHADAPRAHPGHPCVGTAARASGGRSHSRPRALARRRAAGRLDDGDGIHVGLSHRLRGHHGGGHRDGSKSPTGGRDLDASRSFLPAQPFCRRSSSCPIYLPYRRVAKLGMVRPIDTVAEFSASIGGYLASAGRIHFCDVEPRVLAERRRLLLPGLRRDPAGAGRGLLGAPPPCGRDGDAAPRLAAR